MANKIKKIYDKKFQKSKVFLYPLLGLDNKFNIKPINTYMAIEGVVEIPDIKIICEFEIKEGNVFEQFEKERIFQHPDFEDYIETERETGLYIFDMKECIHDFVYVLDSKYSMISNESKQKIIDYYKRDGHKSTCSLVRSYLWPNEYYDNYAEILSDKPREVGEMKKILLEVGELCSKILFEDETIKVEPKSLELSKL